MEIFKRRAKHTQSKGKHWRHREAYKPFGTGEEDTNVKPEMLQLENYWKDPCPISNEKFQDIKEMCDKGMIPKTYHDFFLKLKHNM